jgi:hypothetical protein
MDCITRQQCNFGSICLSGVIQGPTTRRHPCFNYSIYFCRGLLIAHLVPLVPLFQLQIPSSSSSQTKISALISTHSLLLDSIQPRSMLHRWEVHGVYRRLLPLRQPRANGRQNLHPVPPRGSGPMEKLSPDPAFLCLTIPTLGFPGRNRCKL